jgi:hypothetical protein
VGQRFYAKHSKPREFPKLNPRYLRRLLEQNFDVISDRSNSDEVTIVCPQPNCQDRSGNFAIDLKKGVVHCWRCNYGNHVIPFLRSHDVEVDSESLEEIVTATPLDQLESELSEQEAPTNHQVELPEGFTLLSQEPKNIRTLLIAQMAERKHLYLDDFVEAGTGFTRLGDWEPFAIFPVYEMGRLVYYQGRTYAKRFEGKITKKFPSKKELPFGAGHWVYGYDRIIQPHVRKIIIVESILNVLSLRWELKCQRVTDTEPVAVFKHNISNRQHRKLLASSADEFCIMYDGDATKHAWEEAQKLSGHRRATVATMPINVDANDNVELAYQRFLAREQFSAANALLSSVGLD